MKNPQTLEDVNAALEKAGDPARLRRDPPFVQPGFYFVNVGKNHRTFKVHRASCLSDMTIEEWIEELKCAEVCVSLDHR